MEPVHASAMGGLGALGQDPVRILVPTAGVLLLRAGEILALRALFHLPWLHLLAAVAALHLARALLAAPMKALVLASGARTMGRPTSALRGLPSLVFVLVLTGAAELLVMAALAALPLLGAAWLLARATFLPAALLLALAALLAAAGSLGVRATLALCPVEAVVGRRGPMASLQRGLETGGEDWLALFLLLLLGDLALGVGAILGGVLSLPAWPWPHLALVHRWLAAHENR